MRAEEGEPAWRGGEDAPAGFDEGGSEPWAKAGGGLQKLGKARKQGPS